MLSRFFMVSIVTLFFSILIGCTGMSGPEGAIKNQIQSTYGSGFHSFQFKLVEQKENLSMYIVEFKEPSAGGPTRVYLVQAVVANNNGTWECQNLVFVGGVEPKRAFPY